MSSIIAFVSWYFIITLLGWLTFPLAYRLFPGLADRGYSLARTAGLLIWGYTFWLFTSLGLTENNRAGILFGLLVLAGLSLWSLFSSDHKPQIVVWLKANLRLVITVEILFLLAFAFLAFIRAGNPELDGTERPMELMFINAILRSPTFPPHDSWLSGYAISYYYFGYVLTAMLAKLASLTGSVAHNLMTSLIFALAAVGAYGILYNLLAIAKRDTETENSKPSVTLPFLAPLFLLLVSNLGGFLEVLHTRGIFWNSNPANFWTWLDIKELSDVPTQPYQWMPDRYLWWWRASRVISDYDLMHHFQEVIDEFPFFSFLLGDLHPHVLAIPFNLLAVAVALNLFLGGWRGEFNLLGLRLQVSKMAFFFAALTLGGLAFLNTWDILTAAALIVLSYLLFRVREGGWSWARLGDVFTLGIPLGLAALVLFLPFYLGFSSQAGGILPNLVNPTRGAQLWVMFAPLFVPMMAYLVYLVFSEKRSGNWKLGLLMVVGLVLLLWGFSWLIGWLAYLKDPAFAKNYLTSQGVADTADLFKAAMSRRFSFIGGWLTLLALLIPSVAFLMKNERLNSERASIESPPPFTFVFLLIILASLLVLVPEFIYLRDQFGWRINTIFKFYYQAWLLFSMAAAFGTAALLRDLRGVWDWIFRVGLVVLLLLSLTYPVLGVVTKTNNFNPTIGWTLDDFTRIQRGNPDEAAAIQWLRNASYGVVAEAVGPNGGSYTGYARISEYTGMPAVLGWGGHESQWRGGGSEQGSRQDDIAQLYSTSNWQTAMEIIAKYDIRYIYVGDLENSTYPVQAVKFQQHLTQVFQQGGVTIYEVK